MTRPEGQGPKFLLVVPKFAGKGLPYQFPLGIAYISAALKRAGYDVVCLNLNHVEDSATETVSRVVGDEQPDICATGALSPHFHLVEEVLNAARAAKPEIINIVGGGVFSGDPMAVGGALDLDIGVIGEGEETIVEVAETLARGGDLRDVAGIVFKEPEGQLVMTPARAVNKDVDSLPWPDYEGFGIEVMIAAQRPLDDYFFHTEDVPRAIPMVSSRSCPFACTFCFHPTGRVYRERSLDDVFAELEALVERYDINMVAILDELFAVKRDRLEDFCRRMAPLGLKWMVQLRVDVVDGEILDLMKEAGCTYISLGLESMDDAVLESMEKKVTAEAIESALALCHAKKMGIQGNFIFGDPVETLESAERTLEWWAHHREYQVNLSRLQVYPGTPVYGQARAEGRFYANSQAGHKYDPAWEGANLTALDDGVFQALCRRIGVLDGSLKWPARVLSAEEQAEADPVRGGLYRVRWLCPRCDTVNDRRNLALDMPGTSPGFRTTCEGCFSRFDIPNPAAPVWRDRELDDLYQEAARCREQGDLNGALAGYNRILAREYPSTRLERPWSYVQAALEAANILQQEGREPETALRLLGIAVLNRAFDPAVNLAFALALLAEGCDGAALLYVEQAAALADAEDEEIGEKIRLLRRLIVEGRRGGSAPRYFQR